MKKTSSLFVGLAILAASLSSCSRANYAFNATAPSYLGAEKKNEAAAAPAIETVAASTEEITPVVEATAAHQAASSLAHRPMAVHMAKATLAATATAPVTAQTKVERKALRQEMKRQLAVAPQKVAADGKSQLTALILCILLGGIGVHQFYLGYTGRGILRIALALTSFLIVPAIVNLVLYIIDIIKIANGDLKPKNGEYAKKM